MAHQRATLMIDLEPAALRSHCERVVRELRWEVTGGDATHVRGAEDPARLHCHCPPAATEITLIPSARGTEIGIEVEVPAWGIVSNRHARDQCDLLVRRMESIGARPPASLG